MTSLSPIVALSLNLFNEYTFHFIVDFHNRLFKLQFHSFRQLNAHYFIFLDSPLKRGG